VRRPATFDDPAGAGAHAGMGKQRAMVYEAGGEPGGWSDQEEEV